jgi:hypothetical protein
VLREGGCKEGGGGKGGEMTQTLYVHMNKIKIKNKTKMSSGVNNAIILQDFDDS